MPIIGENGKPKKLQYYKADTKNRHSRPIAASDMSYQISPKGRTSISEDHVDGFC